MNVGQPYSCGEMDTAETENGCLLEGMRKNIMEEAF